MAAQDAQGATDAARIVDAVRGTDAVSTDTPAGTVDVLTSPTILARPYHFHLPQHYDPTVPTPLLILLHGYGATGVIQDLYFGLTPLSDAQTFLYAYPDGTLDATGKRFWNATDACCDFGNIPVDDVAYVNAIIDDVSARYTVDTHRIYVVGHSNGGFMAHRLACDLSSRVAAIVSLAGATWEDPSRCVPTHPISVLEVHGDADTVVSYTGGRVADFPGIGVFPGARATVADWATLEGCPGMLMDTGMRLDLDSSLPGAETEVDRYAGCTRGAVELWTIHGGGHIPILQPTWAATIYGFLSAHAR